MTVENTYVNKTTGECRCRECRRKNMRVFLARERERDEKAWKSLRRLDAD